jgi:2-methylisocitrate lyase-like PEP mutase family enzyme
MPPSPQQFLDLHVPGKPVVMPNPWDLGSAKILKSLGFDALATTSRGFAATLGRADGDVSRDEAIAHARAVTEATDLPVNGDFENGFADAPEDVAETIRLTIEAGVAGCSIEDWSGTEIYDFDAAVARVAAAAQAAGDSLILTARAENLLRGNPDLDDTIARLNAYAEAGAHVLYAPFLRSVEDIKKVVDAVDRPVNVLALAGGPSVAEMAGAGAARISLGAGLALGGYAAFVEMATELRDAGTLTKLQAVGPGIKTVTEAVEN